MTDWFNWFPLEIIGGRSIGEAGGWGGWEQRCWKEVIKVLIHAHSLGSKSPEETVIKRRSDWRMALINLSIHPGGPFSCPFLDPYHIHSRCGLSEVVTQDQREPLWSPWGSLILTAISTSLFLSTRHEKTEIWDKGTSELQPWLKLRKCKANMETLLGADKNTDMNKRYAIHFFSQKLAIKVHRASEMRDVHIHKHKQLSKR